MRPVRVLPLGWLLLCLLVAPGSGAQDLESPVPQAGGASGDSGAAFPDSGAVLPDSSAALPDSSSALPDSSAALADSSSALPDSSSAFPDSGAAFSDSAAAGDSVVAPPLEIGTVGSTISSVGSAFTLDYSQAGREEMLDFISANPGEALVMDAGIRYINRGFYGGPQYVSVRGRDPHNTGFLMDGIPVTDPQIEVFDPHWLPLSGVERVEVLKGPSSSLFGGGSTGGAVNVTSHDVLIPIPLTRLDVYFGSFDTRLVGASFCRSVGRNFGFMGAYDYFKTAGYVEETGYKAEKLFGKVSARFPSSLKLDLSVYRHVGDTGVIGAEYTDRLDSRTFLDLSLEMGRDAVFDLDFYYLDLTETFRGVSDDTYDGSMSGVSMVWTNADDAQYVRRLGASFKRKNAADVDGIGQGSAFGEFSYTRGDFSGETVLRVEKNSEHDLQYALSLPLNYSLGEGLGLYGRADRGFSYPVARSRSSTHGPVERTMGASGGIFYHFKVLRLSLNVFYYDTEGATLYRFDETCALETLSDAAIDIKGGEAQVYMAPSLGFEGVVSYSWADATEAVSGASQEQPLNVLAWGIRYRREITEHIGIGLTFAGRWLSSVSLGHRWKCADEDCIGQECVSDAGLPAVKPALLYAFVSLDDARVFFRVRNLFNERIPIAWDQAGLPARSYEFGVNWDLHN